MCWYAENEATLLVITIFSPTVKPHFPHINTNTIYSSSNHSDEGLTLKMSAFKLFTVANYQGSWWYLITLLYFPTNVAPQFLLKLISFIYMFYKYMTWTVVKALNPLTPRSDLHVTSPYNIHTLSNKEVMRILKLIRKRFLSWYNTKFLLLSYMEMCNNWVGELTIRS